MWFVSGKCTCYGIQFDGSMLCNPLSSQDSHFLLPSLWILVHFLTAMPSLGQPPFCPLHLGLLAWSFLRCHLKRMSCAYLSHYVCACLGVCRCMCVRAEATDVACLFSPFSFLILRQASYSPGACQIGETSWPACSGNLSVFSAEIWNLSVCWGYTTTDLASLRSSLDMGSLTCKASTLPAL